MTTQIRRGRSTLRNPFELANLPDEAVVAPGEVGLLLHRSVETLRRWRRDGRGPDYLKAAAREDQAEYIIGKVRRWVATRGVDLGEPGPGPGKPPAPPSGGTE
jgi:hypothetical protein